MTPRDMGCLFSIEQECQTTVEGPKGRSGVAEAIRRFLPVLGRLAPSLSGGGGIFNGYGRIYEDTHHHLEFAAAECDSPYTLVQVVETQYELVQRAVSELGRVGPQLLLVNNNHGGLLTGDSAFWGTHENYLLDQSASALATLALPFLVTRVFAGSGGVLTPTAEFLAAVRPLAMRCSVGGATTGNRAVYSTCREEHHMGPHPTQRRLHLIVGDGHRSHFNLALQMGATALALKAMQSGAPSATAIHRELHKVPLQRRNENWVGTLTRLNRLAVPGALPVIDPSAIAVQRIYLNAARTYVETAADSKEWMPHILEDWQQTLDAYERQDRAWLKARLDTFIKHELFTRYLEAAGSSWPEVVGDATALSALALLDHDYHTISQPGSSFDGLEERGLLRHRVGPQVIAGDEDEPYIPDVRTRARARARFIKDQARNVDAEWIMAWDHVRDTDTGRMRTLFDPYATAYRG